MGHSVMIELPHRAVIYQSVAEFKSPMWLKILIGFVNEEFKILIIF